MLRITSLSNASLDRYPNNTLTKFTHALTKPIRFQPGAKPKIKVLSVALSHRLSEGEPTDVDLVKVHLEQLNPLSQVSASGGFSQCIARFPFPSRLEEGQSSFWHVFDHPLPVPLDNVEEVRELNFFITCQLDKQLKLAPGPTTIINLSLETMSTSETFTLTVDASHSKHLFHSNTDGNFRMKLPRALELDGEGWQMALHSISTPRNSSLGSYLEVIVKRVEEAHAQRIQLEFTPDSTLGSILTELNRNLQSDKINFSLARKLELLRRKQSTVEYIIINQELANLFNIDLENEPGGEYKRIFFPRTTHRHILSEHPPKWSVKIPPPIEHIFVYCDLIKNSIVGNTEGPLVEVVPSPAVKLDSKKHAALYSMPHLTFHSLAKTSFSELQCRLTRADGKPIIVHSSGMDSHLSLTFLFQRVNNRLE